jgi:Zn-dependent peptidase ImmA (M78 family)/transcriptional regulator with XRE-family HTH domain
MRERATAINPAILSWARERAGLSIAEAAQRISKSPEDLAAWESGEGAPTYLQLERLAEKVYKRPVALFFFPAPPSEEPPDSEFRTVPDFDLESLSADTRFAIRDAHAYQDSIRELSGGVNPASRLITRDLQATLDVDAVALARSVRQYLGIDLANQQSWRGTREAMSEWRDAVEAAGVFVLKRSFEQSEIAGFCMFDQSFPLIIVNNSAPFTRQIFTLFHELAHLLFGVSTISKTSSGYVERFVGPARLIEIACNRFAAEFLVPSDSLPRPRSQAVFDLAMIPQLADRYKVSREVVLRRYLDWHLVDAATYSRLVREWDEEREGRGEGSGGNYYATKAAYLGKAFLNLAFGQLYAGRITVAQLAEHLNIRAPNIARLEALHMAREQ